VLSQIKKWCKLVRVLKRNCIKQIGVKQGLGVLYVLRNVFNTVHAVNVPELKY